MKKSELIAALQQIPGDPIVILQKDAEGNGYSPCAGCNGDSNATYVADSTWSGEVCYRILTEEMKIIGYTEDDVVGDEGEACIVLWPIN